MEYTQEQLNILEQKKDEKVLFTMTITTQEERSIHELQVFIGNEVANIEMYKKYIEESEKRKAQFEAKLEEVKSRILEISE